MVLACVSKSVQRAPPVLPAMLTSGIFSACAVNLFFYFFSNFLSQFCCCPLHLFIL